MIYDKSRITEHHEAFYTELDGDTKAVQSRFIFGGIIRGLEVNAEDIAQPVPRWQDEVHPCLGTVDIEGAIKYIFQCSGELSETGVFISVHSTMKLTSACDLIVVRLQNFREYGLSSNVHLMMRLLASLLHKISPSENLVTTSMG
jgi:hypothetical protein